MKQAMQKVVKPEGLFLIVPKPKTVLSLGLGLGASAFVSKATTRGLAVTLLDRGGERYIDDPEELWDGSEAKGTAPSQYDIVIAYNVLQYLKSDFVLGMLLPKLMSRLAPAGVIDIVVSVSMMTPLPHRYRAEELVSAFEARGLVILGRYEDAHAGVSLGKKCQFEFVWVRAQRRPPC